MKVSLSQAFTIVSGCSKITVGNMVGNMARLSRQLKNMVGNQENPP
jgi:hypothetical protein